jgi:FkbM family methyltransferase
MRALDRYSGRGFPGSFRRVVDGVWLRLLAHGARELRIERPGEPDLVLRCASIAAYNRAMTVHVNEPGTIAWLRATLQPGDVLYDVGANIGVFTLIGASVVGPAGRVYAFEPHVGTALDLLHNVAANGAADEVRVLSCALHERSQALPFKYGSLETASSLSELGGHGESAATELKLAASADDLIAAGTIRPATAIKLDVDGGEARVLRGMSALLEGPDGPRSLQIEMNPEAGDEVAGLLDRNGYRLVDRHRSMGSQARIDAGENPTGVPFNAIFERR